MIKRWVSFFWFFCCFLLSGETLQVVAVKDLDFDEKSEALEQALAFEPYQFSHSDILITARFPSEHYLSPPHREEGGRPSLVQGEHLLAVRFLNEGSQKGWVDLFDPTERKIASFSFTFDSQKGAPATEEEFNKVKASHYARLGSYSLPGKVWFRHGAKNLPVSNRRPSRNNLDESYRFITGGLAVSENLALDRDLIVNGGAEGKLVPLAEIQGITVEAIDWEDRLPEDEVPLDPLAGFIPEDQHAIFAPSVSDLLDLLTTIEGDSGMLSRAVSVRSPYQGLIARYQEQLGLGGLDSLAKRLPVKSIAITGSDPYFPTGSAVTVLFETEQPDILFNLLSLNHRLKAARNKASATEYSREGVRYLGAETSDRSFSAHIFHKGSLVGITNSRSQIDSLLEVQEGQATALGASDEFRYFRHRHPLGEETAYLFLSDATIRRWGSPGMRIGASRRIRALAALNELTARYHSGEELGDEFKKLLGGVSLVGEHAQSAHYGNSSFLTPLPELAFSEVSTAEKNSYEQWRRSYERGWVVFDPIALQISLDEESQDWDLSVLPLTIGSQYRDLISLVGEARLSPASSTLPEGALLHSALAMDQESGLFQQFEFSASEFLTDLKITPFSWMGESLSVTFFDGFIWKAVEEFGGMEEMLPHLPLAIRIDVKSPFKLAAFLASLRVFAATSAPDMLKWESRKHGEQTYVSIVAEDGLDGLEIHYATRPTALLISLREDILKKMMDREGVGFAKAKGKEEDAKQFLTMVQTRSASLLTGAFRQRDLESNRQKQSWRALPILNEWRRLKGEGREVAFHEEAFGVHLSCPGGKGYRWNEEELTMESVAYGHPGAPRLDGDPLAFLADHPLLSSEMSFEEDGLRARIRLGQLPKSKVPKAKEEKLEEGELLGMASDFLIIKEGFVRKYRSVFDGATETGVSTLTKVKKEGSEIELRVEYVGETEDGEKISSYSIELLDGSLKTVSFGDDEGETRYLEPRLEIPAKLIAGEIHRFRFEEVSNYEDEVVRTLAEESIEVVGLEDLEVEAGKFPQCLHLKVITESVDSTGYYSRSVSDAWYAPKIGFVKIQSKETGFEYEEELTEYSNPE